MLCYKRLKMLADMLSVVGVLENKGFTLALGQVDLDDKTLLVVSHDSLMAFAGIACRQHLLIKTAGVVVEIDLWVDRDDTRCGKAVGQL